MADEEAIKLEKEIKLPTAVLAADLTPDGKRAFAACLDRGVYEVDTESGRFDRLCEHESYASGVVLAKGSEQVISGGYDGALIWTDLKSREVIRRVQAHRFWSWQLAIAPDEWLVASVTGQYLPGGYKYEPAPEQEECVKVYDVESGELRFALSHQPPVLSVGFSNDGTHLAAANMMGEVRVWNMVTGVEEARWTTPDFTSWGVIKSHHYIGGIFALAFAPGDEELITCGMGPMGDPMAGNGKQRWQQFAWREKKKTLEIAESDSGNGLMETLAFHPQGGAFVMAGRLAQGKWNTAIFDRTGKLLQSIDSKMRVTDSIFSGDGRRLLLAGAVGQERKKDGQCPPFGRVKVYGGVWKG